MLTSTIFAVLGLRAMQFLFAAVASRFRLLSYGLAMVPVFIGTKMLLIDVIKIPMPISLTVVAPVLAITMVASLKTSPKFERLRSASSLSRRAVCCEERTQ